MVRSAAAPASSYGEHREALRYDFFYACAYCSVTEFEARAFGFQIDHYQPHKHGGDDDYANLYWSCTPCNRRKDAFWPAAHKLAAGYMVIRIDQQDPESHLQLSAAGADAVDALTPTGETSIEVLDLNCQRLRRIREIRRRYLASDQLVANGLRRLARARIDQLPAELRALTLQLQRELKERGQDVPDEISELVRTWGKSELIDEDPQQEDRNRNRRAFLKRVGALPMRSRR